VSLGAELLVVRFEARADYRRNKNYLATRKALGLTAEC
jgi:hypothetical protein